METRIICSSESVFDIAMIDWQDVRGNHYQMRSEVNVRQCVRMNDRGAEHVRGNQNHIRKGSRLTSMHMNR